MKIKKGDTIKVLSGNDKGKTGEVLQVIPKDKTIIVRGVNIRKKAIKPKKQGEQGGIISLEIPINVSKVALVGPKCSKTTRVGYEIIKDEKVRVCKKCEAKIK